MQTVRRNRMNTLKIISKLFKLLSGKYFFMVCISVFVTLVLALLGVGNAWCLQNLIDVGAGESELSLWTALVLSVSVFLLTAVCNLVYAWLQRKLTLRCSSQLKGEILNNLMSFDLRKYESWSTADVQTRILEDGMISAQIVPVLVLDLFSGIASCLIGIIYALFLSWQLTVISLVLTPAAVLFMKKVMPYVEKRTSDTREKDSQVRLFLQEILRLPVEIRIFHLKDFMLAKFYGLDHSYVKSDLKQTLSKNFVNYGSGFLGSLSMIASVTTGAYLAMNSYMTIGAVVGFLQLLNYIVWPFTELMGQLTQIRSSCVSYHRIQELCRTPAIQQTEQAASKHRVVEIVAKDVNYSYQKDEKVIDSLNFRIKSPGLAIVKGPSGSGKTTLLKLLLGLYQSDTGEIAYCLDNGEKVTSKLWEYCSYVSQEHMVFSGTVRENIFLQNTEMPNEIMDKVLEKAELKELISSMELGIDTPILENGKNLSFGQCQRISIARALAVDSPIVIFDEPTASLDFELKEDIYRMIREESKYKLCILVSHDNIETTEEDQILLLK